MVERAPHRRERGRPVRILPKPLLDNMIGLITRTFSRFALSADETSALPATGSLSQLPDHFGRVPIGMDRLNLTLFVHLKNVDAFKVHLLAAGAGAVAGPFHSRAVAGNENGIFIKRDALKILADRCQELAQRRAAGYCRRSFRIARRAILGESISEGIRIHRADGQKVSAHGARDL